MSTRIYIPTRGRVGLNRQVTLRQFLELSSHKPVLVCPSDEVARHKAYHPKVIGCPEDGIGPTRQWILEQSSADVVVMADDDMRFSYRPDPRDKKLELVPPGGLDAMIELIERCVLDGYKFGGVSARQGNNHVGDGEGRGVIDRGHLFIDCTRCINFHYFDRTKVLDSGVRLFVGRGDDGVQLVMEDFYFTLSMLTRGHPNRVIYDYVWNQSGSGADGGCSLYRTGEAQARWCEYLKAAFPKFVRVVEKESKDTSPAWKDFKVRKDVIVDWLKAYKSSGSTHFVTTGSLFT